MDAPGTSPTSTCARLPRSMVGMATGATALALVRRSLPRAAE